MLTQVQLPLPPLDRVRHRDFCEALEGCARPAWAVTARAGRHRVG